MIHLLWGPLQLPPGCATCSARTLPQGFIFQFYLQLMFSAEIWKQTFCCPGLASPLSPWRVGMQVARAGSEETHLKGPVRKSHLERMNPPSVSYPLDVEYLWGMQTKIK